MLATNKVLAELTAADLMSLDLVCLPVNLAVRDAVSLLIKHQISGAPVVDARGVCIGVFSAMDFLRLGLKRNALPDPIPPALPITCAFQTKRVISASEDVSLCTLPSGVCPVQMERRSPDGTELLVCGQPHSVLIDWQVVEMEKLPTTELRHLMTTDPVTIGPQTPMHELSRLMIDAQIHHLIVTDEEKKPIGIVSSTDLLAAVVQIGNARREEAEACPVI